MKTVSSRKPCGEAVVVWVRSTLYFANGVPVSSSPIATNLLEDKLRANSPRRIATLASAAVAAVSELV